MKKHWPWLLLAGAISSLSSNLSALSLSDREAGTELNELDVGWSVRNGLLNRTLYNETGQPIGDVVDVIVALDRDVSYLVIDVSDFVGAAQHEAVIPLEQVHEANERLILPGATKTTLAAMPDFRYANEHDRRAHFMSKVEGQIAATKLEITNLERDAAAAPTTTRIRLKQQINRLTDNLVPVEKGLATLSRANESRWQELTAEVGHALEKLRMPATASD